MELSIEPKEVGVGVHIASNVRQKASFRASNGRKGVVSGVGNHASDAAAGELPVESEEVGFGVHRTRKGASFRASKGRKGVVSGFK